MVAGRIAAGLAWGWVGCAAAPALPPLPPGDPLAGAHLGVDVLRCGSCHGPDLGGDGAAPNLTRGRGGVGGTYDATAWARAVREGVAADGRALADMPRDEAGRLTAQDLADLAAWVGAQAPVDRAAPSSMGAWPRWGGPRAVPARRPPARPDAAHGDWLLDVTGCRGCHGAALDAWRSGARSGVELAQALRPDGPSAHRGGWPGLTLTEVDALWMALRYGDGAAPGDGLVEGEPW